MFVILLAGLTAIPPNLYEAAELDGVNAWQAFWSITVPQLAPMILLAITFRLLDAMKLFDTIFIMTGGGPGTKTYTASFYLYTSASPSSICRRRRPEAWIFLILTAHRDHVPGAAPAQGGADLMAATVRRRPAGAAPYRPDRLPRPIPPLPAGAALLDVHHLDQAERRLPGVPPVWFPAAPTSCTTPPRSFPIAASRG